MTDGFLVKSKQCATCIYLPTSALDINKLEADIADPRMTGHFTGYRECHEPERQSGACCRGFWNRHKDDFDVGQIAQRLGIVQFVDDQYLHERKTR